MWAKEARYRRPRLTRREIEAMHELHDGAGHRGRRDNGDEGLPVQQEDPFEARLREVARQDVEGLVEARHSYGDSWKAEGGFSAWFNIKRKIDRLVKLVGRDPWIVNRSRHTPPEPNLHVERYDIFSHIEADVVEGGEKTLDALRDLRRYCLLAEAEMLSRLGRLPLSRDNKAVEIRRRGRHLFRDTIEAADPDAEIGENKLD